MVQIFGSYNPDAEVQTGYEPIPAGDYHAIIVEGAIEDISRHNHYGRCLKLTWKVQGGDFDGRLIWQRINLWGENMKNNDQVIQIANSQMAAVRQATGVLMPKDTDELLQIPCVVKVKVQPSKDGYDARNEIVSVKPIVSNGNVAQQAKSNKPATAASKPWA